MTEVENAARNIIGVEALAKLTRAGIATVWLKDVPEEQRCETCRHWNLESMFVEKSRWAKAWREAAKYYKQRTRFCEEELNGYRDWEQGTLGKALLRIANTDEAFVKLRGERDELQAELKARDKQKCHTCRHLRSGVKCMVCELLHIHTETTTFGCTLWEEVDTHD